jgi:deazaflavin-dependent oxidoreductase (nitroreductase family)
MVDSGDYLPSTQDWVRAHVDRYETSAGKEGRLTDRGRPVVILTSRGRVSGKVRKTPLIKVEYEGCYAAVASLGGAPNNPNWYHNLVADPEVHLQDGESHYELVAREVAGVERELWWARAVSVHPDYADYQLKTERLIPIFVLEPR